MQDIETLKAGLKATWMAGDYGQVAKHLEPEAEQFMARLNIKPGTSVLDVACGSGNLAIVAARAGGKATGADIAANLLEEGRARARAEKLTVQFDEGDAESLPYPDAAFDLVVTMFGAMFAPRPEMATAELVRVCRPGGRIAMANWTPAGFAGLMFKAVAKHAPPPPDIPSPLQWGDEAIVRERLGAKVTGLTMTKRMCEFNYPFTPGEVVDFFRVYFGPVKRAFERLDAEGQKALRHDLEQLWSTHNRGPAGTTQLPSEYLEVIATKPGAS